MKYKDLLQITNDNNITTLTKIDNWWAPHFFWNHNNGAENGALMAKVFVNILKNNRTLTSIIAKGYNIGNVGALDIAKALKHHPALTYINLSCNNIENSGARNIAKALKRHPTLTYIGLDFNKIGDDGARNIAKALTTNHILQSINFKNNRIGNKGAKAIAKKLQKNYALSSINLSWNQISNEGTAAIAKALVTNKTLTSIDLAYNHICEGGALAIAKALATNKTLTSINLAHNQVFNAGALAIAKALATNKTLTAIDLANNNIGNNEALIITKALRKNKTLTYLNLTGNNINDTIWHETREIIIRNQNYVNDLIIAIRQGNINTIKKLLKNGVSINQILGDWAQEQGYSPMMIACKEGNADVIKTLLKYWQDKDQQCVVDSKHRDYNKTALDFAIERNNAKIIKLLQPTKAKKRLRKEKQVTMQTEATVNRTETSTNVAERTVEEIRPVRNFERPKTSPITIQFNQKRVTVMQRLEPVTTEALSSLAEASDKQDADLRRENMAWNRIEQQIHSCG